MTYIFRGFFVHLPESASVETFLNDALSRWPHSHGRMLLSPFYGIGVQWRGTDSLYAQDAAIHSEPAAEEQILSFSTDHPELQFVVTAAECWGGVCEYWGFVCQGGRVLIRETSPYDRDWDESSQAQALERLVGYLGVTLGPQGSFEPFARDFFS